MEEISETELYKLGKEKIEQGNNLIQQLDELKNISGVAKIQKKINSEIASLHKAIASQTLKINNILCSNLIHFSYLIKTIQRTKSVQSVDYPIKTNGNHKSTIRIDIVADDGATWIKVIARNPKALNDIALGRSNYGTRSILDHAISYIEAAEDNQCFFKNPKIIFDFANQIDEELEASLHELNIDVRVDGLSNAQPVEDVPSDIKLLNLDVTTMMAFVSSLTCESCDWEFDQPILTEQAVAESKASTKAFLDDLFEGKNLIACKTAIDSFNTILSVVGGENEKLRAAEFMKMITMYPDLTEEKESVVWFGCPLKVGGKIRDRMYTIITFGMFHKALTVTANKGALEAAKMQGFNIPSVVHEARALTEQKQLTAKHVKRK